MVRKYHSVFPSSALENVASESQSERVRHRDVTGPFFMLKKLQLIHFYYNKRICNYRNINKQNIYLLKNANRCHSY